MSFEFAVPRDTTPEASRVQDAILQSMTPQRRAEIVMELNRAVQHAAIEGAAFRLPAATSRELQLDVIRRTLGDALYGEAFASR